MLSMKGVSPQKSRNICVAICFRFTKKIFILTRLYIVIVLDIYMDDVRGDFL